MKPRFILFLLFTLFFLVLLVPTPQTRGSDAGKNRPPNILLIVVDDLGYGDLSSYNATDLRSPQIDSRVKQGMKFTHAYANCPVCSPTRASILTGCYPERVGVPGVIRTHPENNWGYLSKDSVLMPEVLGQQKYRTAAIGKWHLGLQKPNRPNDRGFDYFKGFLGDMMDDYYNHRRHKINYMRENETEIDPAGHATDLFTRWAQDYIRDSRNSEQPFFLYLAYNAPHTPIQPPREWLEKIRKREKNITEPRAKLVALIEHVDHGIGQVLNTLKECGFYQDTVVLFVSDNGGQVNVGGRNGDLRDGKQSMYEGGIRVPMVARWPGRIPAGSQTDQAVMTMDLLPTLCEVTGSTAPTGLDGVSLAEIFSDPGKRLAERDLFFHRREGGLRYGGMITNAMIRGDWKLVRNTPFGPLELFNLQKDPTEKSNVAESNPRKFREMAAGLRKQIQRGGAVPWQKPAR